MMYKYLLLIGAATFGSATATAQSDAQQAAKIFGARESIESISLSPDGGRLAYVAPTTGQGSRVYTVDLATGSARHTTSADGSRQRLDGCRFVSNQRLVCTIFAMLTDGVDILPVSRVAALDTDGQNPKLLSERDSFYQKYANLGGGGVIDWLPGDENVVLMARQFVPEVRQATRLYRKEEGYGVDRVDTRTLNAKRVEAPKPNAVEYITDGRGTVRMMAFQSSRGATGMAGSSISYNYRVKGSDQWLPFGSYDILTLEGMIPLAVDPELDAAYVLQKTHGRQALYRVSLDGSLRKQLVYAHPQVDVDGVIRIGRASRVVGVTYATDKREAIYFDEDLKSLSESLGKSLPNLPLIHFVDASLDERKLLIWAGSDTDPGRYYVYDKASRQLAELMLSRPQLDGVKLASVKPVSFAAADGTDIPGYLTLPVGSNGKNLPAIVMPHGGPGARDHWGFDWLAQFYANRGYAVLQPNFRGSAGYGDGWFKENGFQSWRTAIGDVVDAGRWLVSEGIADAAKLGIVGWSYGGYAALQSNVVDPNLFKAVVAIAPVTDLNLLKEQYRNWTSFANARDYIGSGPHIRDGSPAQNVSAIRAPVLLFHGELDRNVSISASDLMRDKLRGAGKQVEFVRYPKLDHFLDDASARTDMLSRSDAFLRAAFKM